MSGDQVFARARSIFDTGGAIDWSITKQQVTVDGTLAAMNYLNNGAVTTGGKRVPVIWYESAVLRRSADGWRVQFMQSERAKAAANAR